MYSKKSEELKQRMIELVSEIKSLQGIDFKDAHLVNEFAKLIYRQWPDIDTQNKMFKIMSGQTIGVDAPKVTETKMGMQPIRLYEFIPGTNEKKSLDSLVTNSQISHTTVQQTTESKQQEIPLEIKSVTVDQIQGKDSNELITIFGTVDNVILYATEVLGLKFEKKPSMLKLTAAIKNHFNTDQPT